MSCSSINISIISYIVGVCPLGWTYQLSSCFFYSVGARTYTEAASFCQAEKAVLLSALMLADLQPIIETIISYQDVDGAEKLAVIWLSNELDNRHICPVYPADVNGRSVNNVGNSSCNELHPFICKQTSTVRCINSCFNRGTCVGTTCVCFRLVTLYTCM